MDLKNWENFLNDPELNDTEFLTPDGKYLLGKIIHDVLHCLNISNMCFDLLVTQSPDVAQTNSKWLSEKRLVIQAFIPDINNFWQYVNELPDESDQWPYLIEEVGQKLAVIPKFADMLEKEVAEKDLTDDLVLSRICWEITALKAIVIDIHTEIYKRLWKIQRYQNL